MKKFSRKVMVLVLMALSVLSFEAVRLNSIDAAVVCVAETLNFEEIDINLEELDLEKLNINLEDIGIDFENVSFSNDSKPSGVYSCGINTLEFKSGGTVVSTFLGLQEKGKFRMNGSEITYIGGGIETIGEYDSENNTVTFAGQLYEKN